MTREEAITYGERKKARIQEKLCRDESSYGDHSIYYSEMEFTSAALSALREQEELESVWHNAKDSPPKNPGLYYGKKDDTDSMYLCQYRDGVWTLDAYPETRMHVIKWAYHNAFVQEQEERQWISVKDRLPQNYISVLVYIPTAEPLPMVHEAYIGDDGEWHSSVFYGIENEDVTHWMPMPKTPKEDD